MSSPNFMFAFIARLKNFLVIPIFQIKRLKAIFPGTCVLTYLYKFWTLVTQITFAHFNLEFSMTSLREVGAVRRFCPLSLRTTKGSVAAGAKLAIDVTVLINKQPFLVLWKEWIASSAYGLLAMTGGFIFVLLGFINSSFAEEKILITVNQFVSHISLNAAHDGLNKALNDRRIVPDKADLIVGNAQGSISNSVQISKHHASFKPKFMIAIATPSAQTNLKARGKGVTLAFVAVTDPRAANLTGHDDVIGVTDNPPIEELIDLAMQVFPKLQIVGVISNPGEINSVKITESLEAILKSRNIKLKKVSITGSNDIKSAMNKLVGSVDLIYLPQDNSVVSALDSIASISKATRTPLIASDPALVGRGVLLALGSNYFKSGQHLGNMIADLIEGKMLERNIQDTGIKELKINKKLVEEFGIDIPKNIKARSK